MGGLQRSGGADPGASSGEPGGSQAGRRRAGTSQARSRAGRADAAASSAGYCRKWATERKHLPVQDVAMTGGWRSHSVVQDLYQQADAGTMFEVVTSLRRLKEVR